MSNYDTWSAKELERTVDRLQKELDETEEDRNVWQRVAARLEETVKNLTAELRHDLTQITALQHKLEDCAEARHIAERRLENLQESYEMLRDAKCDKLHEDLTVSAGRLWALQEENERIRTDRDALSAKLNFIRDFIERD